MSYNGTMGDNSHPNMCFNEWFPNVLPWGFGQGVSDAMFVLNQKFDVLNQKFDVLNQNIVNIYNSILSLSLKIPSN